MQALLPHVPQVSNTGCTEVGGFLCIGTGSDALESRCKTAGPLLAGMEAKIVHPDTQAAVANNTPGAHATPAELIEFCRGAIANFKLPRYVRFVDEWPMSGTKIRKVALREQIKDELARAQ